jgi:uncharacterized membrane protein
MTHFTYSPDWRWLVVAGVAAAAGLAWSYYFAKGRAEAPVRVFLLVLRWLAIALVVGCLLDPQWIEKIVHPQKARVAALVDASKSMTTRDVPGGRLAVAQAWAQRELYDQKPANVDVAAFAFSQSVSTLADLKTASPTGRVTELSGALASLLATPAEEPWSGVVVLSDGIETSGQSPEGIARQFRRRGIPIYTVVTGTTNDARDVVIENVQVKRAVPNEAPTRVVLTVRSTGFSNQLAALKIARERDVLVAKDVRLNGGSQQIELNFTPRQKGFQIYDVTLAALPGEWLTTNNHRRFALEVIDPTIRVLYMEGTPQQSSSPIPEWKYLRDALQSDKDIKVTVLYRQKGNNGQFLNTVDADPETNEKIYPVEHPTHGFPRTLAGLLEYDVVIHSDIRITSFEPEQLEAIDQLVEKHGGGFVMIGGNSAFGKGGYHRTILDRIIPVAMENANDSEVRAIHLTVPRTAWSHPLVAFSRDRAETQAIWTEKFPTLYGMNRVERAKPGATVLAEDEGPGGNVLIAVQQIGKGRSLAFTSDTTRSWGRDFETIWGELVNPNGGLIEGNCDSRYYRQFWVNAVRWLAAGRMAQTNSAVSLELAQGYVAPGAVVKTAIKVRGERGQEVSAADVALYLGSLTSSNGVARAVYDSASRSYLAEFPAPRVGSFVVTAVASLRGERLGVDRQLLVSEVVDPEMADLRSRPELMASVARLSGGEAFAWNQQPTNVGAVFARIPPPNVEYRHTPLWDRSWWLATILGLLTVEWTVRRWRGLA